MTTRGFRNEWQPGDSTEIDRGVGNRIDKAIAEAREAVERTMNKHSILSRPCDVHDLTWGPKGGQCLNCGGEGPNCFSVTHAPQPIQGAR